MPYEVRIATPDDLRSALAWLEQDHEQSEAESDGSFWNNRGLIQKGQEEGTLRVLCETGKPDVLAFCLGTTWEYGSGCIDILEVRRSLRRRGLGRVLAQTFIDEAQSLECLGIHIQCKPSSSIPFWRSLGFVQDGPGSDHFHKVLPTLDPSPIPSGDTVSVTIELFANAHDRTPVLPVFSTVGTWHNDYCYLRDEYIRYVPQPDDMVRVRVGDEVLHDYKVKYVTDVGGDRGGGFIRLSVLHRKVAEA